MSDAPKRGAPRKHPSQRRTEKIVVLLTPAEMADVKLEAGDMKVNEWARRTLLSNTHGLEIAEAEANVE